MVAFTIISFLACAREGIGARSEMYARLIPAGLGVLTPLPLGVTDALQDMGFFPFLQGCNYDMPLAFLSYWRARETDWYRATVDGNFPYPYFLYYFASGHPSELPPYVRRKRTRNQEDVVKTYDGVKPYDRGGVTEAMTLDRCRASYDRLLLARDGPAPNDADSVPPGSPEPDDDVVPMLTNDWRI